MGIPADEVLAPIWSQIYVAATSSTAATKDLRLVGPQTSTGKVGEGPITQRYVRIYAITVDVGIVFAASSANADDVAYGTAGTNQITGCVPVFASTYQDFIVPVDNPWLGFVTASAAGSIVVYISSRPIG